MTHAISVDQPHVGWESAMALQPVFFNVEDRPMWLSDLGDKLGAFLAAVDFETFRPPLNELIGPPWVARVEC